MILDADNLRIAKGGATILDGVAFHLAEGEVVGLIGPNGAGKTTLLRCLIGLDRPDVGSVRLRGRGLDQWPRQALAREISYLAQSVPCHWPMAVERVVALGRLPHLPPWQSGSGDDIAAVHRAMEATDITHLRGRQVNSLSGGEQARVQMARALAVGGRLLFADEPVAGLDPGHQIQVMDLLHRHANGPRSVIVVLHDLTLAARYCHRLVLMAKGRVVADGPPSQVLTPGHLAAVYGIRARIERAEDGLLVVPAGLSQTSPLAASTPA
ncbi:MAG: ABC transporter ATP-binding protein [Telmatospirillum sp.]|nr:ABC transporter ATP-binding protein [Telmatospirillum sp.]